LTGIRVKPFNIQLESFGSEIFTFAMIINTTQSSSFCVDDHFLTILTSQTTDDNYLTPKLVDLELLQGIKISDYWNIHG